MGSSTIHLWTTLAADFPSLPVLNRGIGGATSADQVLFANRIALNYKPSKIVYYDADNDLADGWTTAQVLEGIQTFVRLARQCLPNTPIYILAIKPSRARLAIKALQEEANALIQNWIESSGDANLQYIDVATPMLTSTGEIRPELYVADGLHLSAQGYALWTSILKPIIA